MLRPRNLLRLLAKVKRKGMAEKKYRRTLRAHHRTHFIQVGRLRHPVSFALEHPAPDAQKIRVTAKLKNRGS